ncbi:MAG: membrane dipeptidase [Bacteroidia bacterium]|nr:membrane dipeptidase [Bacteroidia bacterium]
MNYSKPEDFYCDLHIHPTLKAFLINAIINPWHRYDEASPEERVGRTSKLTQADFSRLLNSNTRFVMCSITMLERYVLGKLVTMPGVMARVMKMDVKRLRDILNKRPFDLLQEELNYLKRNLQDPDSDRKAVIAHSYAHAQEILKNPNQIALILAIEGSHCLGFEYRDALFPGKNKDLPEIINEEMIEQKIQFMKENFVFSLTLNHFVYNHLATQPKAIELVGLQKIAHNPIKSLHLVGEYRGLTYLGQFFVKRCLEENIILDVKHCDAVARYQIYELAKQHKKPIIASHVAVSGKRTNLRNHQLLQTKEDSPQDRLQSQRFNPWDINIHDDDILAIHQLDGLIGIILDERVLAGEKLTQKIRKENGNWVELFFNQIVHIYTTLVAFGISPQLALDNICIGSDFDGIIDPIDSIVTVEDYRKTNENNVGLDDSLLQLFHQRFSLFRETQLEPEQIVQKIMRDNFVRFMEKYFK